jgi:hypothetical protein
MNSRWPVVHQKAFCVVVLFLPLISGCTPTAHLSTPPENYKGPIVERPQIQKGDYWVYQRGNLTKFKTAALPANIEFPVWVGKRWSYEGSAARPGQPATTPFRISTTITCDAVAFKPITVAAGTFGAFECACDCSHSSPYYEPGCGQWKFWYAPDVKNVIRTNTETTDTSLELLEYKLSVIPAAKTAPGNRLEKGGK